MQTFSALIFTVCLTNFLLVTAQDGPVPPRLNIPGAFSLPSQRPAFRNDRLNNAGPLIRIRKPFNRANQQNSLPPQQRLIDEAKPVTEEPEDSLSHTFIPQIVQQQQQQQQHQPLYQSDQNSIQIDEQAEEKPRFQERPAPLPNRFPPELQGFGPQNNNNNNNNNNNAQRFALNTERPPKPTTLRARTIFREQPRQQQYEPEPIVRQQTHTVRHNIQPRPQHQNPTSEERIKKPVAQILRKYREENEDGSITWGFENDDGSFKEETIGIDCVTRGRYGYIDPDGLKREYNYETGILCDPNKRGENQEDDELPQASGYVNYENNKAILPNGVEINLANMGKKKSKRPGAVLTNPQQFYSRN